MLRNPLIETGMISEVKRDIRVPLQSLKYNLYSENSNFLVEGIFTTMSVMPRTYSFNIHESGGKAKEKDIFQSLCQQSPER